MLSPSSPPPTRGPSIQQLGQQQLLSRNKAELRGDGCQDEWTTTVRRIIARVLVPGNYLLSTAVGFFLKRKHLTSAEYETIDAKEQRDTTEPELCPFRVHLRGPDEGVTSRTPFTSTCPRPPATEAPTSPRPSTMKKNPTYRVTTNAKLNGYLILILDGSDTERETKAGRSRQPEGVRLQLLVLIHTGDSSLHSAQRREGAGKSLQITVQLENFKRQPSLPPVCTKSGQHWRAALSPR